MKTIYLLFLCPFFFSCTAPIVTSQQNKHEYMTALNELRYEVADLKHSLNNAHVEIQILDEQVRNQEPSGQKSTPSPITSSSALEKKIAQIESQQKKLAEELKALSNHANQTSQCFSEYKTKLSALENSLQQHNIALTQITELKSSLLALDQEEAKQKTYKVKPGDSLDKIAKNHKVTTKELKELNRLSNDKIIVGQELKIPVVN